MAGSSMWMKDHRTPQVRPTNLLMPLILMSLQQWNSYGYELMQKTAAFWQDAINPGTLYRTLRQMEKNGDVASTWETTKPGPARRMYSITDAGEAYLELWMASLRQSQRNMDAFLQLYHRLPPARDD
jgi:PadR family transcriptional regulator, regulatory protein PadR